MSDFEMQENEVEFKKKRPVFLLVLVILSGVNLVFSLFGAMGGMLGAKPDKAMYKSAKLEFANMREQLEQANADDFIYIVEQMEGITNNMFKHFQAYNTYQFLVLLLGLFGVVLMYKGRKLGFHFYILYSIGLVVIPYVFNPISGIPAILTIVGVIYGGIWVLLYSRNLHWMQEG
ncbi:MAG: hypothetical protein ACK48O_09095 [Flavobacteriia bacterium]|jgi:hypothetical protein